MMKNAKLWIVAFLVAAAVLAAVLVFKSVGTLVAVHRKNSMIESMPEFQELKSLSAKNDDDAGPVYLQFRSAYRSIDRSLVPVRYLLQGRGSNPTMHDREEAANSFRPFVGPLISASQRPHWSMPHTAILNVDGNLDQMKKTRAGSEAVRFLCEVAVPDYETGHQEEALQELTAAENITRQLGENPDMESDLESALLESQVISSAQAILRNHLKDARVASDILSFTKSLPPMPSVRNAIIDYRDSEMEMAKNAQKTPEISRPWSADQKVFDEAFPKLPSGEWDWYQTRKLFLQIDNEIYAKHGATNKAREISRVLGAWGNRLTRRNILVTAAQLVLLRATTGSIPASLPDLGSASLDPFSQKPLIYRPTQTSFSLSSVGMYKDDFMRYSNVTAEESHGIFEQF